MSMEATRNLIEAVRNDCFLLLKQLLDNQSAVGAAPATIADMVSKCSTLSTNITNAGSNYSTLS